MDKLDLILWVMGGGFAVIFGLMIVMWNSLNKRIDGVETGLGKRIDKVDYRLDKLEGIASGLNTRMTLMESKMTDLSANVSHLMWHTQAIPPPRFSEGTNQH